MAQNPLQELARLGQSVWLDTLSRDLIQSGKLKQLIEQDALRGVTSNPTIFQKAISAGDHYDGQIAELSAQGKSVAEIYEALTVQDVQDAADLLRPTWESLQHADGFVSLEVNPHLAYRTEATLAEVKHLWAMVDRPNSFIKIPATQPGLEAIRQATSAGVNVNVTLLFGLPRYEEVVEAYMGGLEERLERGETIEDIHSVASFFLSRIDVLLDPRLEEIANGGGEHAELAGKLVGQAAIASAREAYRICDGLIASERWQRLKAEGANLQRLLWASTSTKNPAYPDVKYVEALVAPETVNTVPMETIDAYRDHGQPQVRINDEPELTREVLEGLGVLGIDLQQATEQLEREGVEKFNNSYDDLMGTLQEKRAEAL